MKFYFTGDTHGTSERFDNFFSTYENDPAEVAIIILGDASLNYYRGERAKIIKRKYNSFGCKFYIVRGNHEDRPENVKGMLHDWDMWVQGPIYYEEEFPNIRYLRDGYSYVIDDLDTLVIGGAYSVDKFYRLMMHYAWFPQEQLTEAEMTEIEEHWKGQSFDMVLTHTCPYSWEPTDLFISGIDQSTVDSSMEHWMEKFQKEIDWKLWLCGHYHADRVVAENAYMMYENIMTLEEILNEF